MLILTRLKQTEYGVFGLLSKDEVVLCHTLERPWIKNARSVSCIPLGTYHCTSEKSIKFPYLHYRLHDVINRSDILIHRGNTILDTTGCILVGMLANEKGIGNSKDAMNMLTSRFPQGFTLQIKD